MANIVKCESCSREFHKPQCQVNKAKHVFCSRDCYNDFQRKSNLNHKICKICGVAFKVHKSAELRYSTCSNDDCRTANKLGEHNPNWRGGQVELNGKRKGMSRKEYKEWRNVVLARDKFQCTECKSIEKLEVDHIKPYAYFPELRIDVNNGITLCKKCHGLKMKEVFVWRKQLEEAGELSPKIPIHKIPARESKCVACSLEFYTHIHNKIFCTKKCANKWFARKWRANHPNYHLRFKK